MSTRTAGEVQCKFCKAKPTCPEHAKWQASMLPTPVNIFDVPIKDWSPEQRASFCERRAIAQKWLNDCEAEMKKVLANDPTAIPGWGLIPGNVQHPITDPQELCNRFLEAGGTIEQFMQCVGIAKEKFTAQLRAATKLKGKVFNAKLEKMLNGVTEDKPNQPSLGRVA